MLDVLRLSLRHKDVCEHFCAGMDGSQFVVHLLKFVSVENPAANQMLALRSLANIFSFAPGEALMKTVKGDVLSAITQAGSGPFNKHIQIAVSTVLLNYGVAYLQSSDIETKSHILSECGVVSSQLNDPEAHFRLLIAIGTLLDQDANLIEIAKSMEMSIYVTRCRAIFDPKKVSECAEVLARILS